MVVGLSSTLTSGKIYYHCVYLPGAYDPQILWSAHMETGNLSEWNGEDPTGSAVSTAVTAASQSITAHGGSWVMKQAVTGSVGGTRMNPYAINGLSQAGTTFYATWWEYHPFQITFSTADQYQIWQIASQSTTSFSPIWGLYVDGADFTLRLIWSPDDHAPSNGPHNGETGKRVYTAGTPVPLNQWVRFEAMVTPAGSTATDFTGALKIWMNNAVMFDLSSIKTRFPDVAPGGLMYTTHNAYGSNLTPTPAYHFVDDVTYSLGRMP
jgi:polysaccharide lyase-like protein